MRKRRFEGDKGIMLYRGEGDQGETGLRKRRSRGMETVNVKTERRVLVRGGVNYCYQLAVYFESVIP